MLRVREANSATKDSGLNGIAIARLKNKVHFFYSFRDVLLYLGLKLGTKQLPTAELQLDGTRAHLVSNMFDFFYFYPLLSQLSEPGRGVAVITQMVNITRLWNAVSAASGFPFLIILLLVLNTICCVLKGMRRTMMLVNSYASKRQVFGSILKVIFLI